jgi:hypothetical protein
MVRSIASSLTSSGGRVAGATGVREGAFVVIADALVAAGFVQP